MKRRHWTNGWGLPTRPGGERGSRGRRVLSGVAVVALLGSAQAAVVPAAGAQQPTAPISLPPLESGPAPAPEPEVAVGDFSGAPPHPDQRSADPPAPKESFDPARSTVIEGETTPTKLVYANPDDTRTAVVSQIPVRFRDQGGAWRDIDRSLVATAGGGFGPKAAPEAVSLGALAQGAVATVAIPAGDIVARHPDALPVPGIATGDGVTYPKALPGGRDLIVRPVAGGFTESVVLPDAAAPASYRLELVLPPGVAAAQAGSDVALTDAGVEVVARFGSGLAFDASWKSAGPPATAPVTTRLLSQDGAVATVEVGVDAAWLGAAGRSFPVTIDPTLTHLSAAAPGAFDTWVYSGEYADTSYGAHPWLVVGSADGGVHITRSLLRFDTSSLPTGAEVTVMASNIRIFEWYSYAGSCAPRAVEIFGLAASPTASTTWNNQPGLDGTGLVSSKAFAHHQAAGSACPEANVYMDTTSLARRWLTEEAPNHGLTLRAADETDPYSYKAFLSAEGTSDPNVIPTLSVTYNRRPGVATPYGPGDGAELTSPTPTLAANLATDPDGDAVKYWFRATTGTDAESGAKVVDSGWIVSQPDKSLPNSNNCAPQGQPALICYVVPTGAFEDGQSYSWHVLTWDSAIEGPSGSYTYPGPNDTRSLSVDAHLGVDPPAPTDTMGPVTVNLASGNAVVTHASPAYPALGGPIGLSLAYNSLNRPGIRGGS